MDKKKGIILFSTTCVLFLFLFIFNDIVINIRLLELRNYLQNIDKTESNLDHIALIAKYNLHKKVYENKLTLEKADEMEFEIYLISSNKPFHKNNSLAEYKFFSIPVLWLINFNRMLIGNGPINIKNNKQSIVELDLAYYYERNNLFRKAVENYGKALKKRIKDNSLVASILLHQGYCLAVLGDFLNARKKFIEILENYGDESVVVTATILLRYIEGFHNEHLKIVDSESDSLKKSEKLYNLLAYERALEVLDKIEYKAHPLNLARVRYYKARCYDSIGSRDKAVDIYFRLITANPSSRYARLSNRRLFVMGTKLGGDNEIKNTAVKINKIVKDKVLHQMINKNASYKKKEYDKINNIEVKISKILRKRIGKFISRGNVSKYLNRYVVIETGDFSKFKGKVIAVSKSHITLNTLIGEVKVVRNKIVNIKIDR